MSEQETLGSKVAEMQNSVQPAQAEETKQEESKQDGEPVTKTEDTSGEKSTQVDNAIDYKAQLEEAQARLKRAEDKIVKLKKQPSEEEEEVDEDRVAKLVAEQVGQLRDQVRGEIVESEVEDMLSEISNNPDERALIKHIYEHDLQSTGFTRTAIKERLQNAKILANKQALLKSNTELAEALASKSTISTTRSISSSSRPSQSEETKRSETDRRILARMEAIKMNK